MAAINSGRFGTAEHAKKAWKLGIIWPSGMKPRNMSCYMAYLDGFSPDYCNINSDRFYYVIVSVSSLVLTQQKQKYLKENTGGERRKW